jgi:hypothetical protein
MWRGARDEMTLLYRAWCDSCTPENYATFLAARDRADAAQDALAAYALGL